MTPNQLFERFEITYEELQNQLEKLENFSFVNPRINFTLTTIDNDKIMAIEYNKEKTDEKLRPVYIEGNNIHFEHSDRAFYYIYIRNKLISFFTYNY